MIRRLGCLLLLSLMTVEVPLQAQLELIVVDDTSFDIVADGNCTLPEAVQTANTGVASDACSLPPVGVEPQIQVDLPAPIVFTYPLALVADVEIFGSGIADQTFECPVGCLIVFVGYDLTLRDLGMVGDPSASPLALDGDNFVTLERVTLGGGDSIVVPATSTLDVEESILVGFESDRPEARGPSAEHLGGALEVLGTLQMFDSTMANNRVFGPDSSRAEEPTLAGGGAIACDGGSVTIFRSTVSGNEAEGDTAFGGGLFLRDCGAAIVESTIVGNQTDAASSDPFTGAGIRAEGSTSLTLFRNVIGGNIAMLGSGGLVDSEVSVDAGVPAAVTTGNFVRDYAGAFTTFAAGTPNAAGDFVGSTTFPLDLEMGPLQENGGPTPTHLPLVTSTSWIVDRVVCSAVRDQRGFDNGSGGRALDTGIHEDPATPCDIGAVEAWIGNEAPLFVDGFESGDTAAWQ